MNLRNLLTDIHGNSFTTNTSPTFCFLDMEAEIHWVPKLKTQTNLYPNSDGLEAKYVFNMTMRLFGSVDPPAAEERGSEFEREPCFKEGEEIELALLNRPEKVPDLSPNIFLMLYFTLNLLMIYAYINEYHKLISREDQQQAGKHLSLFTLSYFGLWNFFSLMA